MYFIQYSNIGLDPSTKEKLKKLLNDSPESKQTKARKPNQNNHNKNSCNLALGRDGLWKPMYKTTTWKEG